jgi:hypothetical protein
MSRRLFRLRMPFHDHRALYVLLAAKVLSRGSQEILT